VVRKEAYDLSVAENSLFILIVIYVESKGLDPKSFKSYHFGSTRHANNIIT
jgi:hypothetical protein